MIIFIFGDDSQAIRESRQKIINEYQKKHSSGLNMLNIDASLFDGLDRLEDSLKTISFFDEIKLVNLFNPFSSDATSEKVLNILKNFDVLNIKEVVVMVSHNGIDKELIKINKDLFEYLKKGKPVLELKTRQGRDLVTWVINEIKKNGSQISESNANLLISKAGNSLTNEINKLSAYRYKEEITKEDINIMVRKSVDSNIFEMIDACANEKRIEAIRMLKREMDLGATEHYVLSMLAFQYRNLLFAKGIVNGKDSSASLMRRAGIKPFTLSKSKTIVLHKNNEDLIKAHKRLGEIDVNSKNGLLDIEDALYDFILRY